MCIVADCKYFIRLYRADGSYDIMEFTLNTTTAEIISVLSSATENGGKKASTNMRLYLRAGGQGKHS